MSLALAKKSLRLFESHENSKDKHNKKSKVKIPSKNDKDAKIRKLLLLNSCMDDTLSKKLLKNATKTKRATLSSAQKLEDSKLDEKTDNEGVFTEEDFRRFGEEYKLIQND